jgi:acyl-CoA synthetase (AMP-forming)/AMP-acid ligase II
MAGAARHHGAMTTGRLLTAFNTLVDADPDAVILFDAHAGRGPALPVTRQELRARAAEVAAGLRALGVEQGDCVAVWLPNWSQAVAVQLAALAIGAHVIGVNTRYNVEEVTHVLAMARPRAVVIAHGFHDLDLLGRFRTAVDAAATDAPSTLVATAPGAEPLLDVSAYDVGAGAVPFPSSCPDGSLTPSETAGLATAFTTSGSTGRPKLAGHGETALVQHALAAGRRMGIRPGDLVLGALPLSGVFGFNATMAGILAGAAVLLEPTFDAPGVLADMAHYGVTHVAAGDDLLGRLVAAWRVDRPALSLRWIGIADFEGRAQELSAWAETEVGAQVTGLYGSSELFALTAIWPTDYPSELRWTGGGQVVMPEIRVRVVDPATGRVLPEGEDGELQFRGPNVVEEYLGDPGIAATVFTADGWFRSGDLGRMVAADVFQYICRMGDVLRLRGFLVDPAEIEHRLVSHGAVRSAKVVGVPGPEGGTLAVAFVVPEGSAEPGEEELQQWCAATLAKFKVPSQVHVIDQMPTTSGTNGTKIRAAALREMAMLGQPRAGR